LSLYKRYAILFRRVLSVSGEPSSRSILFSQVVNGGIQLLSGAKTFAPRGYLTAHKGTPFYVMGLAAFLSHDYETATFLLTEKEILALGYVTCQWAFLEHALFVDTLERVTRA
jgi:hypothetical protein